MTTALVILAVSPPATVLAVLVAARSGVVTVSVRRPARPKATQEVKPS